MDDVFAADDDVAFAARVRSGVGSLGGAFFLSNEARQAGKDLGLRGWPTYFVGRCGVLGPVDGDVVASVCGFFPESFVHKAWDEGLEVDLSLAVEVYLQACQHWGRVHLGDFTQAQRLAELAEKVVRGSQAIGAPIFAGWRVLPLADDSPARLAQLMTMLRELRGGLHLAAVLSTGMTPREAIISGPGGASNAAFFGWTDPEIEPTRFDFVTKARAEAERKTDRMMTSSWLVLSLPERAEFATLLDRAVEVAFPSRGDGSELGAVASAQ